MPLFVPSSGLLTQAATDQQAEKLCLASRDWFVMQNHVQAVLALPIDFGEYQGRYGDATSGSQMKECFDAMRDLRKVATKYGNPKGLRAKITQDPAFLALASRPTNDAFAATVWTLQRAHQDAFSLASTLKYIPRGARGEDPSDVVAGIKSLFLDTDQILDKMNQTRAQLAALFDEFEGLARELDRHQHHMQTFTERSSKTRTHLDAEIGGLRQKIAQLEKDRDAAYQKWLDLTIAAATVSAGIAIAGVALMVFLAVPTGGGSFAVGSAVTATAATLAATGLGVPAGMARSSYEGLVKEVSEQQDYLRKRVLYRHDLGALDDTMKFSLPASSGLLDEIRVIRDAWTSTIRDIQFKVSDLSVDTLTGGPWLKEDEMVRSAAHWLKVDGAFKAFALGSFVDPDLIAFGSALPKDDPEWLDAFRSKFAA
jgi:hypothetical protein